MSTHATEATPIGSELERARLEHRARRIERVLGVLRERRTGAHTGPRSAALDQAIAGFGEELGAIRSRLRRLS
jgi:hypothetical protein